VATFYSLKIKDLYKETSDCTVLSFEVPNDLKNTFQFQQGQHLTLKKDIGGEDIRRSYSLCSSPYEDQWKVAVKQIPEGKFSTYINQNAKIGDVLEVMPPSGHFGVPESTEPKQQYVAFVAGSGITPVLSMMKTHLEKEPDSKFTLFYVNKTVKSIIFKEEIEQLRNQYFGRVEIFYFLTQEHRDIEWLNGRFTEEKLELICSNFIEIPKVSHVFLCGPEAMVNLVKSSLEKAGLPSANIHFELFVSGLSAEDIERAARLAKQNVEGVQVTLVDGGKEFHFAMTNDYTNLLDAALGAGADLPFACKGGVCSTCKCKVLEGDVEMKINYALEAHEVEQDFVLSCQAVPTSKAVKIDFDV